MKKGIVYLVGAGPGDKGLLTCKGYNLLKEAQVVVYDRLVSKEILALVSPTAKMINVGKNSGNHLVPQEEINSILLEEALKGQKVIRLKGGDPFVFGRGGEELELLLENNVDFQVVPGITSSISAPAYGGIPVTHRDYCSSLHIITGHAREGETLSLDFEALVRLNGTLIFMMSVSSAGEIGKGLLDGGMKEDMPCGIVEKGTYPEQRTFVGTVGTMGEMVKKNEIKSPAVIIVGKVATLGEKFNWFDRLPLKNKKILVTQPKSKASVLGDKISLLGGEVILHPSIKTKLIEDINPPFEAYDILGFTSVEGVKGFMKYLEKKGLDSRNLAGKKIAVIGSQTGRCLKEYGIKPDFIPSVFDGEHMAKEMVSSGFFEDAKNIILLRARIASEDIIDILKENEIEYLDYPIYETEYIESSQEINLDNFDWITFTSKSCVTGLVKTHPDKDFSGLRAICIGSKTQEEADKYGFNTVVADEATVDSMIEKLVEVENHG